MADPWTPHVSAAPGKASHRTGSGIQQAYLSVFIQFIEFLFREPHLGLDPQRLHLKNHLSPLHIQVQVPADLRTETLSRIQVGALGQRDLSLLIDPVPVHAVIITEKGHHTFTQTETGLQASRKRNSPDLAAIQRLNLYLILQPHSQLRVRCE